MSGSERPPTVTNYVLETIRNNILTGRYPADSKLDQKKLAEELGVSMIPVRESLRQLDAEGMVRIYPRRGAYVAPLSVDELEEVYLTREVLEELVTRLAVPEVTPELLARLAALLDEMEAATAKMKYSELLDLNRAFHFALYEASGRSILLQLITGLWDRSRFFRQLYTYIPERAPQALAEHQAIFAAVKAGDAEAAGAAVRENVRQTVLGILAKLEIEGSP